MIFGGIQKNSFIDYPGKVSCILFVRGCNFRCPYCHNADLVNGGSPEEGAFDPGECVRFLESRTALLDGVVISGGEPTLQGDLPSFCRAVRDLGYPVKLDTNGSRPQVVERLIDAGLVDYIAMDVKTDPRLYGTLPGLHCRPEQIQQSIRLIMDSGLPYEFRTTCVRPYVDRNTLPSIAEAIEGARLYVLQSFEFREGILDPGFFEERSGTEEDLSALRSLVEDRVESCMIR